MLINEKTFKLKEPEAVAFRCTQAHYLLFRYTNLVDVLLKDIEQINIDASLSVYSAYLQNEEKTNKAVKSYAV